MAANVPVAARRMDNERSLEEEAFDAYDEQLGVLSSF
jgi:hypothetical protein